MVMYSTKQELVRLIDVTEADIEDGIPRADHYNEYHVELCEIVRDILYRGEISQHIIEDVINDLRNNVCLAYLKHVKPEHRSLKDQEELNKKLFDCLHNIVTDLIEKYEVI